MDEATDTIVDYDTTLRQTLVIDNNIIEDVFVEYYGRVRLPPGILEDKGIFVFGK